jgi:hypothetical protein
MERSAMRSKVVGLVAAAALLASVGIANAEGPVKLTVGTAVAADLGAAAAFNNLVAASTSAAIIAATP